MAGINAGPITVPSVGGYGGPPTGMTKNGGPATVPSVGQFGQPPLPGATQGGGPATVTGAAATALTAAYNQAKFANELTGANRDAFLALNSLFTSYGLSTLAPKIFSYIQNGYSADTISLLLQDTAEYKTRFSGNELRKKAGLAVLNPADYLATEASYRQVMASAGLPPSFYDSPTDFAQWIGGDVSPTEIKSRVDLATAATTAADPYLKQQLAAFYGVDDSHLTAYFLDQSKALPLLQKQEQAAQFGAEAARRGLLSDKDTMMDYVNQGFTQSQASQGFQQVAAELPNLQALAARFGTTFSQSEEESTVFGTNVSSLDKKSGLGQQEKAMFSGNAGSAGSGLSAGYKAT